MTVETPEVTAADDITAIGNDVLAHGHSALSSSSSPASGTPTSSMPATPIDGDIKFSFKDGEDPDDEDSTTTTTTTTSTTTLLDDNVPVTKKLHQRLSTYSPQVRESEEWEQIMQDWERVMAEKRIQDAKLNLVEQENKRMKTQLSESETARLELEKETQEKIASLEKTNKELVAKAKDPLKEKKLLQNQLEEAEAEKELFKLMLEETESEKKRIEQKFTMLDKERDLWAQKQDRLKLLKNRLRLKSAQFSLLSTSTSVLLAGGAQGLDGARPDKERKRLMDQVSSLESDRSRLAAMVKDTMGSSGDYGSDRTSADVSTLSKEELVKENQKLKNEVEMSKVECSLLQRRIEAFEVTLHDVRVALTNSEAQAESLELKKYDLQDKLTAAEGSLDRARIESTKYQALHKELLEKNAKFERELEVVKARFDAKDRVLITTQKQLAAAKVDGGLLKTIRRELESVLFDYNTVVQHFMDIQVQAMGAKALANALKRQTNELQSQLTHYRTMLLGIKSFNNNDPIKSPTVTTLRSEFRILLEKIQEEQNNQIDRERGDKYKAQDWNRKLRMEKDFMKLELQNQIEKWRRVSIYWEDKWRKAANDLHEAVTSGVSSELLFEVASAANSGPTAAGNGASTTSPRSSVQKRASLAVATGLGNATTDQSMTPSALKQHILDNKVRSSSTGSVPLASANVTNSSPSSTITDLVSSVKPFLNRSLSQSSASCGSATSASSGTISSTTASLASSLIGSVGIGRSGSSSGPLTPSSRLHAAQTLRTPIAAGLPSNLTGVGAMGSTAVSKTSLRSKNMAASAIGSARNQALQAGVPDAVVTAASKEAQTRAKSSISTVAKSVDQALSESDQLKADVRRMLNR
ncbi:hypothetical protein BGZ83_006302 [Gryganskiella cystojenkinii]|nr:hypothetical protein BGZ83_006302 [Gryganskiella cystojenkinii]